MCMHAGSEVNVVMGYETVAGSRYDQGQDVCFTCTLPSILTIA